MERDGQTDRQADGGREGDGTDFFSFPTGNRGRPLIPGITLISSGR